MIAVAPLDDLRSPEGDPNRAVLAASILLIAEATSVLGRRNQPEDSEDDDVPLAQVNKVKAKRWVEGPGKFVAKLDKTEKLYLECVQSLLARGESDRRTLRRRKGGQEASGREERLNLEQVLVAARRY